MGSWLSKTSATDNDAPMGLGERIKLSNNRVVVYVWKSKFLGGRGENGHIAVEITRDNQSGNLINNTYLSFWPILTRPWPEGEARPLVSTDGMRWTLIEDYTGDRLLQRRKPELIFCFYTLTASDIMRALELFRESETNAWDRIGKYVPRLLPGNVDYEATIRLQIKQSCVSLACLALDAGGINHLIGLKGVVWASSKATTGVSSDSSEESYKNLNFIQPSTNVVDHVTRQLISAFIMSPDVLVERLKYAKNIEWNANPKFRFMDRTTFTTVISVDGIARRSITISSQPIDVPLDEIEQTEGNVVEEKAFEWLPGDK